jgi:glyoxylase-like metal-dependent hydrolase (beta-lactamase superfamily II)
LGSRDAVRDPNGVRVLFEAGHSVTGADDPRLGDVHVVLLTHPHGDHMGDRKLKVQGVGTSAAPKTVSAAPPRAISRPIRRRRMLEPDT